MIMVVLESASRQISSNGTDPTDDSSSFSFESWLASYWYTLLIVLAVLIVVCVLICACILRKHPRSSAFHVHHSNHKSTNSPDHGGSSEQSHQSSMPTMPSISADSTPIPSPHSSQHSVGLSNGGGRNRRTSPRHSSTSSDTLRPDIRSMSSNSSASLMGHSPTRQQGGSSPMERRGSLPRRTRSGPMVRVTSMPDVKNNSEMRSAPSTVSVESSSSGRSGVSYKFQPANDSQTFVEVGVTVHTPGDPDKAVRIATAAALAESARKLAQEAASFIDNEDEASHYNRGRPYLPSTSGRSSSFSLSHTPYIPSRPAPLTTASLDNPSSSLNGRVGGDSLRGEYPMIPSVMHYPMHMYSRGPRTNDSDYHTESDLNFSTLNSDPLSGHHFSRSSSTHLPFQRGRPYRSSLDSYQRDDFHRSQLGMQARNDRSSLSSSRETSFSGRYPTSLPISEELNNHRYHTGSRRLPADSYPRRIPFHLTAAGRRQSAPSISRRSVQHEPLKGLSERPIPPNAIEVPFQIETPLNSYSPKSGSGVGNGKRSKFESVSRSGNEPQPQSQPQPQPRSQPLNKSHTSLETCASLTQSPSTSTGLSSNPSSQLEEGSQQHHPSQEAPNKVDSTKHSGELNNDNTRHLSDTVEELLTSCDNPPPNTETEPHPKDDSTVDLAHKSSVSLESTDDSGSSWQKTRALLSKESMQSSLESEESIEDSPNVMRQHGSTMHSTSREHPVSVGRVNEVTTRFNPDPIPVHSSNSRHNRTGNSRNVTSKHYSLPRYQSRPVTPPPKEMDYLTHAASSPFQSSAFPQVHSSQSSPSSPAVNVTVNV